ncbi:MAG: branched-chain amino acid ABC transporter permease [Syntrophorhabdales bacterium]|jgi:branched-chain amino acid transport system permease protein
MLPQQLVNGLMLGAVYSLVAIGFNLIFGVLNLLNFAHAGVLMAGAYATMVLISKWHLNIFAAIFGSMVVCSILGIVVELMAFRPIKKEYQLAPLIATIGLNISMEEAAAKIFGATMIPFPRAVEVHIFKLGPIQFTSAQILILGTSVVLMLALHAFIKRTRMGKAIRATAADFQMAAVSGVNLNRVNVLTFVVSSALAGAAGSLIGLNFNVIGPYMGASIVLKGFVIILLAGLGNVNGAMYCGLILGEIEVLSVAYISSSYRDAFAFLAMVLILIIRPSGLFGSNIKE